MRLPSSFRSSKASTLATNLLLLLLGLVTSIISARALQPEQRGVFVGWQTWVSVLALVAMGGFPQALVLDKKTLGRHSIRQLWPVLSICFLTSTLIIGIYVLISGGQWQFVIAASLIALATFFSSVAASEAQRAGTMRTEFNMVRILPSLVSLIIMPGLILLGIDNAADWLVAIALVQAVAMFGWLLFKTRELSSSEIRPALLRDSWSLAAGNLVTIAQYRFDLLAVAILLSPTDLAFYAIGVAGQLAVLAAGNAHGMTWFSFRRDLKSADRPTIGTEIFRTVVTASVMALPVAVTTWIWVPLLYGDSYSSAIGPAAVLALVGIIQSVDYLLAHEVLILQQGHALALFRIPSLIVLGIGFWATAQAQAPLAVMALLPGIGFALSSSVFLFVSKNRRTTLNGLPADPPATATAL